MSKKHKILMTTLVVGLAGALAGFGVFAAFSSTTSNPSNSFAAGTVTIGDNDGGTALFSATPRAPGNHDRCIKVTYSGNLDATVKLYTGAITGTGSDLPVTIHKAAPTVGNPGTAASCSDFDDAAATKIYPAGASAPLSDFGTAHSGWANGLAVNPGSATKWVTNDAVVFRVRINIPDSGQGKSVDPFALTWEAQNQ
jgi:predicted ribosomally synthesized peptide with SipW-like signal peptide